MSKKTEEKEVSKFENPNDIEREYEIEGSKGIKSFTIKHPSRELIYKVLFLIQPLNGDEPDFGKAGEMILHSCFVHEKSDLEILTDDEYLPWAALACIEIIQFRTAALKKK